MDNIAELVGLDTSGAYARRNPTAAFGYWELGNLGLVQWYLNDVKDISIKGNVFITGANGAGKSSALDAVQLVLVGGDESSLSFNARAQADEKSKRSIKDYCLGTLDDIAGQRITRVRDSSNTYLLLGFRHTRTGKEITVGIYLEAALETDRVSREPFIIEGKIILAENCVWAEGETYTVKTLKEFAAEMSAHSLKVHAGFRSATKFRQKMHELTGPNGLPVEERKYLRALMNALRFKGVKDASEFVRTMIIDAGRIPVENFRNSVSNFQAIGVRIQEDRARVERLKEIETIIQGGLNTQRLIHSSNLVIQLSELGGAIHGQVSRSRQLREAQADEARALEARREAEAGERTAQADLEQAQAILNASSTAAQRKEIEWSIERSKNTLKEAERDLQAVNELVASAQKAARDCGTLNKGLEARLVKIAEIGSQHEQQKKEGAGDLITKHALIACVQDHVSKMADELERAVERAKSEVFRTQVSMNEALDRRNELTSRQQSADNGRVPLSKGTEDLIELLRNEGIVAEPLCAVVRVTDESWRAALESKLRADREALIVSPGHVQRAKEIRKRAKGKASDGRIIDTTYTPMEISRGGTLADVIETENPLARGFLDFRLGRTVCVDRSEDLIGRPSAITRDLEQSSGRVFSDSRKIAAYEYMLGKSAEALSSGLTDAIREADQIAGQLAQRHVTAKRIEASVEGVAAQIGRVRRENLTASAAAYDAAETQVAELVRNLEELGDSDRDLIEAVTKARVAVSVARGAREEAATSIGACRAKIESSQVYLEAQEDVIRRAREACTAQASVLFEDGDESRFGDIWTDRLKAQREIEDLKGEIHYSDLMAGQVSPARLDPVIAKMKERRSDLEGRNSTLQAKFVTALSQYLADNNKALETARPDECRIVEGDAGVRFVREEIIRIEQHALIERELEAKEALKEVTKYFMDDYVTKAHAAFKQIGAQISTQNKMLKTSNFHGQRYQFKKQVNPELADMYALINRAADRTYQFKIDGTSDQEGTGTEDPAVCRAVAKLQEFARNPQLDMSHLTDPSNYFVYNIEMMSKDEKTGLWEATTNLTERKGTSSGAQHQVPIYVALLSALRVASYPDGRCQDEGGISLCLLDEAFNNMDANVVRQMVGFMRECGIQTIMVSSTGVSTYLPVVDTYISYARIGSRLSTAVQYPKPAVRKLFDRQDPRSLGQSGFLAAMEGKSAEEIKSVTPAEMERIQAHHVLSGNDVGITTEVLAVDGE